MKYILLFIATAVIAIVIGVKIAIALLFVGGLVTLIGLGAAASCVAKATSKCDDKHSPLIDLIWGPENE